MTKKNYYRKWMESGAVNIIFAALDNNARFVGGAVRDAVLEKDATDIDITTPFHPGEVTKRLEAEGIKIVPTGIKHGTVTAVTPDGNFEITTLRRDVDCTGRHAEVEFTDNWEEDAARRDFTINAMSCNQRGEIFDYFGGLEDLKNGHLRFVGDAQSRCREDYLRILRFFRFLAYYGRPPIDNSALMACKLEARGIEGLSGERIQTEMFKLLSASTPIFALQLMLQNNVMEFVIPEIRTHDIATLETLLELKDAPAKAPLLRLATLIGARKEIASGLIKCWKLSNADKTHLLFLCDKENRIPANWDEKTAKRLMRAWGKENFLDICHISFAGGIEKQSYKKLTALQIWQIPEFPLTGKDLKNLGFTEGKALGAVLVLAEGWWEENNYTPDKKALLEYVRKNITK